MGSRAVPELPSFTRLSSRRTAMPAQVSKNLLTWQFVPAIVWVQRSSTAESIKFLGLIHLDPAPHHW